ncbi:hypothetical protein TNCV_2843811 [Trichonephila clavipes]|nr:hypothetical protein TNCV_2843811 [Trichonephila clavipes]
MPVGWRSWFVAGLTRLELRVRPRPKSVDFLAVHIDSIHVVQLCGMSLECLLGLGALRAKLNSYVGFASSEQWVHLSGEEIGCHNCLKRLT